MDELFNLVALGESLLLAALGAVIVWLVLRSAVRKTKGAPWTALLSDLAVAAVLVFVMFGGGLKWASGLASGLATDLEEAPPAADTNFWERSDG